MPGERVLLLGSSGSGKSTLVAAICGLVPHSSYARIGGSLALFGMNTLQYQPSQLSRRAGVVFQDPDSQLTMLTVEDEVAFGLENLAVEPQQMEQRIQEALSAVGLLNERGTRVDRLSGGMKQRLVIGAILAMQPDMLVLDEPTSNLDPEGAREVALLLRQLTLSHPQTTILLVEHRLDALVALVSRVLVLDRNGALAVDAATDDAFGPLAEALDQLDVWLPTSTLALRYLRLNAVEAPPSLWSPEHLRALAARNAEAARLLQLWGAPQRSDSTAAPARGSGAPAVTLEDVGFAYQAGRPVLNGVNLQLQRGEMCALVGGNGSGKSTLAALAAGLMRPDRGRVLIEGIDSRRIGAAQIAARVGFVFQNPEHQFVTDRVFDEVAFTLRRTSLDEAEQKQRVERTLQALRLDGLADRNPFELSHGQKRRLSVASMLVAEKDVLIFDEPTFGQDPRALDELLQMVQGLQQRSVAVMIVTHDMELVWRHADRVALLLHGRIARCDSPERVFCDHELLSSAGLELPARLELLRQLQLLPAAVRRHEEVR